MKVQALENLQVAVDLQHVLKPDLRAAHLRMLLFSLIST